VCPGRDDASTDVPCRIPTTQLAGDEARQQRFESLCLPNILCCNHFVAHMHLMVASLCKMHNTVASKSGDPLASLKQPSSRTDTMSKCPLPEFSGQEVPVRICLQFVPLRACCMTHVKVLTASSHVPDISFSARTTSSSRSVWLPACTCSHTTGAASLEVARKTLVFYNARVSEWMAYNSLEQPPNSLIIILTSIMACQIAMYVKDIAIKHANVRGLSL